MLPPTRLLVLMTLGCDQHPHDASARRSADLPLSRFTGFMQSRLIIALLTAGGIAFACGPRPSESEAASAPAPTRRPANSAPLATTLELSVAEGVDLRLHVTNTSGKKIEMTFAT